MSRKSIETTEKERKALADKRKRLAAQSATISAFSKSARVRHYTHEETRDIFRSLSLKEFAL